MNFPMLMDILFDLLNESELLDVQDLEEIEAEGVFHLTTGDGTKVSVRCEMEAPPIPK